MFHTPDALFTEEGPPDWTTRVWVIPRRKLAPLLPGGTGATLHIPHRHGTVALAAAHMELLTRQADRLEPAAEAVVDYSCRLLAIAAGVAAPALEGGRAAALERVSRYVDRHLAEPDLTPERAAKEAGLSLRQLHRVFEPTGESFARHVPWRRLEEARATLSGAGPWVADVAFGWGFEDLRTFGRAFQRVYGLSPGEALAMARQGTPPPVR